jgi:hypothetical protein
MLKQSRNFGKRNQALIIPVMTILFVMFPENAYMQDKTSYLLPDGTEYVSWEVPVNYSKTYYVDNGNPNASDSNEGTQERPFRTIGRAAEALQPGERVVIRSGVYREQVRPQRGGSGADKLISYEAAPGAKVIVKGSVPADKDNWQKSTGFRVRGRGPGNQPAIFQYDLEVFDFKGYNPFGMSNIMIDKGSFPWGGKQEQLKPYYLRRGMVFVNGRKMKQVEMYADLASNEDAFWVEHNGLTVHLRLSGDVNPANQDIEFVIRERVFAPKQQYLAYIRIKGITFEHGASGFPVPQRGLVSTNRGNHWIIEDCVIRHANSVGLDIGRESWNSDSPVPVGYHIVRRTQIADAGISGIAGVSAVNSLIESCLIENIGWQNVEQSWESAGIKIHFTNNNVIANCLIRDIIYASGIWLDADCKNSRITNNLIANVKQTQRAAVYIEASHFVNKIDQNIIWNVTTDSGNKDGGGNGVLIDGCDENIIAHNLIGMCDNAAFRTWTEEWRIHGGGGGITRWNYVLNNVFYRCAMGIDFSHKDNFADGNLYGRSNFEGTGGRSFINRILNPEKLRPNVEAWKRYFGFDENGGYVDVNIRVNLDSLTLTWSSEGDIPNVLTGAPFKRDFLHKTAGKNRKAGPFAVFPENNKTIRIDPRIKSGN